MSYYFMLQIWAFLHIPKLLKLLPNTGRKGPDEFPLLVQWTNWLSLDLKNNFHKNLKSKFSDILDNLKDEDVSYLCLQILFLIGLEYIALRLLCIKLKYDSCFGIKRVDLSLRIQQRIFIF